MANMQYLLNCKNFISLIILFSFFDNFGTEEGNEESDEIEEASQFDIVLFGGSGVGKTQICNRYCKNTWQEDQKPTMGVEFYTKNFNFKGNNLQIRMWDCSGWDRFKSFGTQYYFKNYSLIVFVYAVNDKESFENLFSWFDLLKKKKLDAKKILLVGNKCDLEKERQVSTEEGQKYAKKNGVHFIEVSAKMENNITEDMFNSYLKEFLKDWENKKSFEKTSQIDLNKKNANSSFCDEYCSCCPCLKESEDE